MDSSQSSLLILNLKAYKRHYHLHPFDVSLHGNPLTLADFNFAAGQETAHKNKQTRKTEVRYLKDRLEELPYQYLQWRMECCNEKVDMRNNIKKNICNSCMKIKIQWSFIIKADGIELCMIKRLKAAKIPTLEATACKTMSLRFKNGWGKA